MQATAQFTRVGPTGRIERLLRFNNRLQGTPDSMACFRDWRMNLSRELVDVKARVLPPETIFLGRNQK